MLKPSVTFLLTVSLCSGYRGSLKEPASSDEAFPELWLDQSRDHFDTTNTALWPQRYWQNFQHYRGQGLAFLMLGGEGEEKPNSLGKSKSGKVDQWSKWAEENGAAMFVLEHRYYGRSHPTVDLRTENMKFLSSRQGLEDAGHFISAMTERHNLTTWITFGGSYSGSLSAWMRLRFPHLLTGSGPLCAKLDHH